MRLQTRRDQGDPRVWLQRARLHLQHGRWHDAAADLERTVHVYARLAPAWAALATARFRMGDLPGSVDAARLAVELDPNDLGAGLQAGLGLLKLNRPREALQAFERCAPQARAADATYHLYRGEAELAIGLHREASSSLLRAAVLAPANADIYLSLGYALRAAGLHSEAAECFRTVVALKPDSVVGHAFVAHDHQYAAQWVALKDNMQRLLQAIERADAAGLAEFTAPFVLVGLPHTPRHMLMAARASARAAAAGVVPLPPSPRQPGGKLRVGYLSGDFHHHATSMLLVEVLEQRDTAGFEVTLFSHGKDDGSPLRARVVAACDRFVDLRECGLAQTAQAIRDHSIDILVDLKGYTSGARIGIFGRRPAPLQVGFLGYPGTCGSHHLDYFIGDPVTTPPEMAPQFTEKIAQMPRCYQPNDGTRALPAAVARSLLGLPEAAFVMCCFNQIYKLTPAVFDVWCALLRDIPGSVLWLMPSGEQAARNLRREAAARGIGPERLVYAPPLPLERHLARLQAADVFVDTTPCAAHTTASDALWAGLPLVTVCGETFASRVAASLLTAQGVPELVAGDLDGYARIVRELAAEPARRAALRERIAHARSEGPLFQGAR
ncbi:MAG: tetratricopeptide repeat protein, partial [Rubrivivax sp.]|nr:tetratricopeptide repeat protein [Rubrivivax sp.]